MHLYPIDHVNYVQKTDCSILFHVCSNFIGFELFRSPMTATIRSKNKNIFSDSDYFICLLIIEQ
jgi:hypothetical protein